MPPERALFGHLPSGEPVERVTLRRGDVTARIITYGASLQALMVPDKDGRLDDIVLGHDDLAGYLNHRMFFGATVGRVANRIAGGRFTLDGRSYGLSQNEGTTTLHGGAEGFDRRNWQIVALEDAPSVRLRLVSPDGDQGFPGRLEVEVVYALEEAADGVSLAIRYEARTDAPTPIALTNHSYFALAGSAALATRPMAAIEADLTVPAARYLPVDGHMIPLPPEPVGATPFDFRAPRPLAASIRSGAVAGYDHCLCLDGPLIEMSDPVSGRVLRMQTDQPGVQLYTGNFLDGSVIGKAGHAYQKHDGMCLEAQAWPDLVNAADPQCAARVILAPGEVYHAAIVLGFATDRPTS
ncbi:aldose epimerase family protein [Thioclava sp. A2]|uniref:aldose epimerase family protein n=1 Tax=Thioclava sp. FCG-A2 TaxID=3080562 RepID=UPI002953A9D8|nr:aldose epimerase family protein [Thioclava sp. A2]MDV7269965.1 aldose epimerase family protein [Thioclava sp. A2]